MTPKEIFGILLRVIGVVGIACVVRKLDPALREGHPTATYLVLKAAYILIGLYFLRGAPLLMSFAYPEGADSATAEGQQKTG